MRDSVSGRNLIWGWNAFLLHRGMYTQIFNVLKKFTQRFSHVVLTLLLTSVMYAPWKVVDTITVFTQSVSSKSFSIAVPFAYAASYSSVITTVTTNGKVTTTSSSSSGATSSYASVITVTNGADGAHGADGKSGRDGVSGSDGADGMHGVDGKDGAIFPLSMNEPTMQDVDIAHMQTLRMLIEKLTQLITLLKETN